MVGRRGEGGRRRREDWKEGEEKEGRGSSVKGGVRGGEVGERRDVWLSAICERKSTSSER